MLGKLIKIDLRFAYKQFLAMALLLLVLGVLAPYLEVDVFRFGIAIAFAVAFTAIPIISVWLIVQHFHRNLFGNEGYLMFSLPVSARQLLISKSVTTMLWFNLMLAATSGFFLMMLRTKVPVGEILSQLLVKETLVELGKVWLLLNANVLAVLLALFMGLSLGTVTVHRKKLGAFWGMSLATAALIFFEWCVVKVERVETLVNATNNGISIMFGKPSGLQMALLVSLGFAALFFFLTNFIMERKLNLE